MKRIPEAVIAVVSEVLSNNHTEQSLRVLMLESGAPGEEPDGSSKAKRCMAWLRKCGSNEDTDALAVLGRCIEAIMETSDRPIAPAIDWNGLPVETPKERVAKQLATCGLKYVQGGKVVGASTASTTQTLADIVRKNDLRSMQIEFDRMLESVEQDPGQAVTAACALLESTFKHIIAADQLPPPPDQSVLPLWKAVRDYLGLDPKQLPTDDLKKIAQGIASVVDGVGCLRTHAGSAHGQGPKPYRVEARHARLAIHSASTVATFVLESRASKSRCSESVKLFDKPPPNS